MLEELSMQLIKSVQGILWNGRSVDACCSIGIVRVARRGVAFERLYEEVDEVLYAVKRSQKGGYQLREIS